MLLWWAIAADFAAAQTIPDSGVTTSPWVTSFERFARHSDIGEQQAGLLLRRELGCAACHAEALAPKPGPNLAGVGLRVRESWLADFLSNPQQVIPGTTMPDALHAIEPEQKQLVVKSLVAFLMTQRAPFAEPKAGGALPVIHEFWDRGDPRQGKETYQHVGCVACHEPARGAAAKNYQPTWIDQLVEQLPAEELEEIGLGSAARPVPSIPLGSRLQGKYSARSLTMFLLNPTRFRPAARMPHLGLSPTEAADVAAFLAQEHGDAVVADDATKSPSIDEALVATGKRNFQVYGCINCHQRDDTSEPMAAPKMATLDWSRQESCVGNATGSMPRYTLDSLQLAMLQAGSSAESADPQHAAELELLSFNCFACHARNSLSDERVVLGGVGIARKAFFETQSQVDFGDEGRLPPPLTGVGSKLKPKVLQDVLSGKSGLVRPYLSIRMPAFPATVAHSTAQILGAADGSLPDREITKIHPDLLNIGRELANTGCVECHPFNGQALPGVVGVDLATAATRLQPRWFQHFVEDPGKLKLRTRMPTFFPDGKSNRQDLAGGDVNVQISALWHYLSKIQTQPLPPKIEAVRNRNYELTPEDRPIVLRTFMDDVGTHAIAIGFPEGVNLAFDAETVALKVGWKGRFLDARGTWFERFTPPAQPLGKPVRLGAVPPFAPVNAVEPLAYRFEGYELDGNNAPVFHYRVGGVSVEEHFEPMPQGLRRIFRLSSAEPEPEGSCWKWQVHTSASLTELKSEIAGRRSFVDAHGVSVDVIGAGETEVAVGNDQDIRLLQQQIDPSTTQTLKVEYRW